MLLLAFNTVGLTSDTGTRMHLPTPVDEVVGGVICTMRRSPDGVCTVTALDVLDRVSLGRAVKTMLPSPPNSRPRLTIGFTATIERPSEPPLLAVRDVACSWRAFNNNSDAVAYDGTVVDIVSFWSGTVAVLELGVIIMAVPSGSLAVTGRY